MDEIIYGGLHSSGDYADKALMSPENLMISAAEYGGYHNLISSSDHHPHHGYPSLMVSDENIAAGNGFHHTSAAASEAASFTQEFQRSTKDYYDDDEAYILIKAKIASHPCYPKLIEAYVDCQKVGAPPEIASLLDEIRRENELCKRNAVTTSLGTDPELDEFMETYRDVLLKYKSDLWRPFNEATTFLNNMETQLGSLCRDDGGVSSDEEVNGGEMEAADLQMKTEDQELKDRLLREYGSHISTLKLEFSKKKKKGKLPKEARQTLLEWWNLHYKWPYPTEADKISLAELTGLDQKQINNWFINQRKRHWKPSENMQLAVMNNLSGQFFADD